MYYGTCEGFEDKEVCVFIVREQLDRWLNGEDLFYQHFGSISPRKELTDKARIRNFLKSPNVVRIVDFDGITWLLNRN